MEATVVFVENVPEGYLLALSAGGSRRQGPIVVGQTFKFSGSSTTAAAAAGGTGLKIDILSIQGATRIGAADVCGGGEGRATSADAAVVDVDVPLAAAARGDAEDAVDTSRLRVALDVRCTLAGKVSTNRVLLKGPSASAEPLPEDLPEAPAAATAAAASSIATTAPRSSEVAAAAAAAKLAAPASESGTSAAGVPVSSAPSVSGVGGSSSRVSRSRPVSALVAGSAGSRGAAPAPAAGAPPLAAAAGGPGMAGSTGGGAAAAGVGPQAISYLSEHNIMPFVESMMRTLMRERPADPWAAITELFPEGALASPSAGVAGGREAAAGDPGLPEAAQDPAVSGTAVGGSAVEA
eukprot:TRINITY_DN47230_c0_g1_i1.p1 TRINITY_DN47230_c0_g1~~TRINITY_DN47230_c0_g1_i1.p1  ORF type:complete len:351 (-),score=97.03 TRINITY_DN47230_c0_g1_i1:79-1131(-)